MVRNTYEVQNLGDLLREKRKQLGKTINDISEHTKIRAEYLLALETGKYDKFASNVYAKGFLKKYAKYLGISPERAVALYRREETVAREQSLRQPRIQFQDQFKPNLNLSTGRLAIAAAALVVIVFLYYIFSQINVVLKAPEMDLSAPVTVEVGQSQTFATNNESVIVKGRIDLGSKLRVNDSEVNLNNLETFEVPLNNLEIGENRFSFTARSQFGQESQLTLLVNRLEESAGEVAGAGSENSTGLSLEINARENNTYLQIEADGRRAFADNLNADEAQSFQAQSQFKISSAKPAAVVISINGQPFTLSSSRVHQFTRGEDGNISMQVI